MVVRIPAKAEPRASSKRKSAGRDADQEMSNRGQWTGGKPEKKQENDNCPDEGSPEPETSVRAFLFETSITEGVMKEHVVVEWGILVSAKSQERC